MQDRRIKADNVVTPNVPASDPGVTVDMVGSTSVPPPAKVDPYIGKTIDGRYLVEAVLGEGGMGVVYRGKHKVIDKRVAIKILRGDMAKDKEITERFLQEAKAASSIGNPHIVDISDFGTLPDGSTYFVMEYLAGKSLADAMSETRPLPVPRLMHIAKQIALGLGAAHEAGIVHRDLKPDNIMLVNRGSDKDFAKILDFGIAKVGGAASRLTRAGSIFGTPHYMSPEQAMGTPVDLRTDVYALGIILYEMASGKVPFDADNFMGILTQHQFKKPVPILALVPAPDIPPALDAIVQKCLTKRVEGRYSSMAALISDLEMLERGETPAAVGEIMARSDGFNIPADYFRASAMPPPVPATPTDRPRRRVPVWIPIAAVASLVGVVAVLFLINELKTSARTEVKGDMMPTPSATQVTAPPVDSVAARSADSTKPASATEAAAPRHVVIMVEPDSAKVTRDGSADNLNTAAGKKGIEIDVPAGQKVALTVTAPGYKPVKQAVDDSQGSWIIHLEPASAPKNASSKPPKDAKPAPSAAPEKCNPLTQICGDPFQK
jgi:tRNA A-37 threonylcarbamoyl transferase component Bud32